MAQSIAITRAISPSLAACELTHLARVPIDLERARAQHRAYEEALIEAGYLVERLDTSAQMPDSVFVEDIAVVFEQLAIITRPGAESRRQETPAVAEALAAYRPLHAIQAPGTVDGGDVLVAGRSVVVGRSSRTNEAGALQMRQALEPLGYSVSETMVRGCLHLKSAITWLGGELLLANPGWIDRSAFARFKILEVDPSEPAAANALRLHDRVICSSAYPRTAERIARAGCRLHLVDASELAKAEGAVTCCSLIVDGR
jgi:dimethylargininase